LVKALIKSEKNILGNTYVHTVLIQVQTLEFTILYDNMSRGRGGGEWRSKFNKAAFQASDEFRHVFADLSNAERNQRMSAMGNDYKEWLKKSQETVTRRNRLFAMYKMVSFYLKLTENMLT
jgi:hypothetical protein